MGYLGYTLLDRNNWTTSPAMKKNTPLKIIAANLKSARLSKQMTQADVAKAADIAPNHYARIERAEVVPSILTIIALAQALGAKYQDILPTQKPKRRRS